jgi:ketosteroid isomerase-like protein
VRRSEWQWETAAWNLLAAARLRTYAFDPTRESNMKVNEIAKRYVELCKAGKFDECLNELFAEDAVSVEAFAPPGQDPTSSGLAAIRAKGEWWTNNHEVHGGEVHGPYPNGDRFAVRFAFDLTFKPTGKRQKMDEIGLFTVKDGKIIREEFFYQAE